jgi:hypothetical protein
VEVQSVVEQIAARPAMLSLFRFDPKLGKIRPTGNRPTRPGFRCEDLGIPHEYFEI